MARAAQRADVIVRQVRPSSVSSDLPTLPITHEVAEGHGFFRMGEAHLEYVVRGGVMDLRHTLTPKSMRGQGVAEKLCAAAFAHAKEQSCVVVPSCTYIAERYVPAHKELDHLVLRRHERKDGVTLFVDRRGVATILLDDEPKRNPLSVSVLRRLEDLLSQCEAAAGRVQEGGGREAQEVSVVLLAARGPVFSSGHNMSDFLGLDEEGATAVLDLCARVNMKFKELPQPTIALVDGLATAGGCQLACSCDIVLASERAKFLLPGVRDRFFCHTPAVALADRVGTRKAFEMTILSTEVSAAEALGMGLANRVFPVDSFAREVESIVGRLATFGQRPNHMGTGKRVFYEQVEQPTLEQKYAVALPVMANMMASPLWQRHSRRFFEKRAARKQEKAARSKAV